MDLSNCIAEQWSPGIGDPGLWGWIVVAAYATAAFCALGAAFKPGVDARERWFWGLAALALAMLGVNKQLDLQSALTAAGRCLAHAQGWYEVRGRVQVAFIGTIAVTAIVLCGGTLILMRRHVRRLWPAILGLALVIAYVAIRAAGFHHVDRLISVPVVAGIRANPLLEMTGIALIVINGVIRCYTAPSAAPSYAR